MKCSQVISHGTSADRFSVPLHRSWKLQMISATVFSNDWSDRRGFSCVLRDHDDVPHFQLVHHPVTYEHKCGFKGENLVLKVIWLSGLNMNWNSKPFFLFLPGSNFKVRISSRKLLTWEFADWAGRNITWAAPHFYSHCYLSVSVLICINVWLLFMMINYTKPFSYGRAWKSPPVAPLVVLLHIKCSSGAESRLDGLGT